MLIFSFLSPALARWCRTLQSYPARDVEMVVIMVGLHDLLKIKDASELLDLVVSDGAKRSTYLLPFERLILLQFVLEMVTTG